MTEQEIGLLVIQSLGMLSVLGYLGVMIVKKSEERQQFRLYAVRDKLVYLAAIGDLPQNSLVFRVFYGAINASISEAKNLNLASLVRASIRAKTFVEKQKREKLIEAVRTSPTTVQEVVDEFFATMMDIVYENSLGLRLFVACSRFVKSTLTICLRVARALNPPKPYAYEAYEYWREMHRICHV